MINIEAAGAKVKKGFAQFKQVIGKTLIDVEIAKGDNSCVEDSDSLILHFNDGSELLIWGDGEANITVEED